VAVAAFTAGAPAGIAVPAEGERRVTLGVHHCPHCGADTPIDVQLTAIEPAKKGSVMYQAFLTYPGAALSAFEELDRTCQEQGLRVGK
jgi:hypothetical protein